MIDPFGRKVTYLRVSVTDRCDLRCSYCMPEKMNFLPKSQVLSLEELERVCSVFIELGVKKIRLTGGEPLVRKDIILLIQKLGKFLKPNYLNELTITTNGTNLENLAQPIYDAGVKRINVSLDTLKPDKFRKITRKGDLSKVLHGLEAAKRTGLEIKINTVALMNYNDDEFDNIISWCGKNNFDLTFIETMPMGNVDEDRLEKYLPLSRVRETLSKKWTLKDIDFRSGGPARYMMCEETKQKIGFITPLSHNFCESCNRVRLTCTGKLYMCLGQDNEADLRKSLRSNESNESLIETIYEAISRKPKGHDFIIERNKKNISIDRHMSVTGG